MQRDEGKEKEVRNQVRTHPPEHHRTSPLILMSANADPTPGHITSLSSVRSSVALSGRRNKRESRTTLALTIRGQAQHVPDAGSG